MIHYMKISISELELIVKLMIDSIFDNWTVKLDFKIVQGDNEVGLAIELEDKNLEDIAMSSAIAFLNGYAIGKGINLYGDK
jgi:hypothetical protein